MPPQRTGKKEKPKDAKGTLRRVLRYIMDYRLFLAGVVLLALASNVLSLLGPSLAGQAIGAAAAGPGQVDMGVVWYYAKRMLVCYLASSVLAFLVNAAMMRLGKLVGRRLRTTSLTSSWPCRCGTLTGMPPGTSSAGCPTTSTW